MTATNAAGESIQSNEVSAKPTAPVIKSMTVNAITNKASYLRRETVTVTTKVTDSQSGSPIGGALVKVTINAPNLKVLWTGSGTTNSDGLSTLTYRLSNSALKGTYTVTATVTCTGYLAGSDQTTFTVK